MLGGSCGPSVRGRRESLGSPGRPGSQVPPGAGHHSP